MWYWADTGPVSALLLERYRPSTLSRYQGNGYLPLCTSLFYRPGAVNRHLTGNIRHRNVSLPASLSILTQYRASNGPLYLTSINWHKSITGPVPDDTNTLQCRYHRHPTSMVPVQNCLAVTKVTGI